METVIKVDDVSKIYKLYNKHTDRFKEALNIYGEKFHEDFIALNHLSFEIKKGETVGILGKNGSGKSTLLKMITGVLSPSTGNIIINGRVSALLELGGGFNLELTGIENIYLNGSIMGFNKKEMESKMDDICSFAEIGEFIHQPVKMYSSGMFARLAFALAINVQPDILIVDEALAVGDIRFQAKCFEKFKALKKQGVTILFVSHDVQSIRNFCDKAMWINSGELLQFGDTVSITSDYIEFMNKENSVFDLNDTTSNTLAITNKHEVDNSENKMYLSKFNPIKRWGKNVGLISYADILDEQENTLDVLNYEQKIKIKVRFSINESVNIDTLSVAVSIKNTQGIDLIVSTTFDNEIMRIEKNKQWVEVDFKLINYLNSGDYVLVVALEDRSQSLPSYYDFIEGAKYFKVLTKQQLFGIVNIPVDKSITYI